MVQKLTILMQAGAVCATALISHGHPLTKQTRLLLSRSILP
jgi:hypothetical protein